MSKGLLNKCRVQNVKFAESKGLISPLIHIGQFKTDCKSILSPFELNPNLTASNETSVVAAELNTDEETIYELEQICSEENLKCPGEAKILNWEDIYVVPKSIPLQTLKRYKERCRKRFEPNSGSILKARYTDYQCEKEISLIGMQPVDDFDKITGVESVITIAYNFPRTSSKFRGACVNIRVLGSQKLTELRDVLPCEFDSQPVGDFTNNPDHPKTVTCKDLVHSSFFFFENTFYNDFRKPENVDLSYHMLEWAKHVDYEIPQDFKCVKMEDYTFDDLKLRLGTPYLYMHLGDCEHIIIVKDIRLLHPDDCLSRSKYPIHLSRTKTKCPHCTVCKHLHATWVTHEDELAEEDPSYFCDDCFRMLHYHNGKKVANFIAFPYINAGMLDYPSPKPVA